MSTPIAAARSSFVRPCLGVPESPIMVLCEPQTPDAANRRHPMGAKAKTFLDDRLRRADLMPGMFQYIALCPPIPEAIQSSAKKTWDYVQAHLEGLDQLIADRKPRMIVTIGALALRAIMGKSMAITKSRGIAIEHHGNLVFPILSPGYVLKVPEHGPTFDGDLGIMKKIIAADFDRSVVRGDVAAYEWCFDLQEMIDKKPKFLSVDTEGTGLKWYMPETKVLTIQLTPEPGRTLICPIHPEYRARWFNDNSGLRGTAKLRGQLRTLLSDPDLPKVAHNLKFDHHVLRQEGIDVKGWAHDTQLVAFAVDENMQNKGLDDCVKRWVPSMAGYADQFNAMIDKSRMIDVQPEDEFDAYGNLVRPGMRNYAGGDPDATFRLAQAIVPLLRQDPSQYNCYRRIMIPGIMAFATTVEVYGQHIDTGYLRGLENEIRTWVAAEYSRLIKLVPAAVRRKHVEAKGEDALKFSRDEFMRDVLFSREGFKLKPKVFTDTTAHLPEAERVPSVSTKLHMPYFTDLDGVPGEFVRGYIDYQKAQKLLSTYIGQEAEGTGFWKYLSPTGQIHPSYMLHRTNTGRTASQDPNGQNIPKRGDFAKSYRKAFRAAPGFRRVDADLSQIELRLIAWMAREEEMLRVYASGGDIHTETGCATNRMTLAEWMALPEDDGELIRFKAKAVNFGFVYGMQWRGFRTYAKTQYGVEYTDGEAQETRQLYFAKYKGLLPWHARMKDLAHKHGYVRSIHGAIRRLPSIWSDDESIVSMAERQAVNAPIQRMGSDFGVIAASILARHADPEIVRPIGFIHDCLACEARIGYEEDAAKAIKWIMQNIPLKRYFGITPPIPIIADAEVEDENGKMQKRKNIEAVVPWFWKDEVEEDFERRLIATGCNAYERYISPHHA